MFWLLAGLISIGVIYFLSFKIKNNPKKYFTSIKTNLKVDFIACIIAILLGPIALIVSLVGLATYYYLDDIDTDMNKEEE